MGTNSTCSHLDAPYPATRVTIGIATTGRATLKETLASIQQILVPDGITVQVLIADDSLDGSAEALISSFGASRFPLEVIPVASRNISTARNALLQRAEGEWIAFVDDDEWVDQGWLGCHIAAAREFGADAVIGPVFACYPEDAPVWFVRADPWRRFSGNRGEQLETGLSGNAFVNLAKIRALNLSFDPSLGRTGGGDTDFFYNLHANGGRVIATDDAVVSERVTAGRLRVSYLIKNEEKGGHSYGSMVLKRYPGGIGRCRLALDGGFKLLIAGVCMVTVLPFDRSRALRLLCAAARNRGKLRAALGLRRHELYKAA